VRFQPLSLRVRSREFSVLFFRSLRGQRSDANRVWNVKVDFQDSFPFKLCKSFADILGIREIHFDLHIGRDDLNGEAFSFRHNVHFGNFVVKNNRIVL
jgi:hypothetical protein